MQDELRQLTQVLLRSEGARARGARAGGPAGGAQLFRPSRVRPGSRCRAGRRTSFAAGSAATLAAFNTATASLLAQEPPSISSR